jgi:DNA-binding transcriptional LysR family regulator
MAVRPLSPISVSRKLKLSQLMVFSRVLDSGSFVRAASDLGLTQPAISKSIFELESFFDEALFTRSNRGVMPTDFGTMLGQRVQSLMAELRYMADEVQAYRKGEAGHVIVGTLISASAELLPRAISKLQKEAPGVLVTIREGTAPYLYPSLATSELDIVVGRLPDRDSSLSTGPSIKHEVLYEEAFCIVAGPAHPLAGKPNIVIAELASASWIFALPDSPARLSTERLFHDADVPVPVPQVESLSLLANLGLMQRSELLSFMPRVAALQLMKTGSLTILDTPATRGMAKVGFSVRADKAIPPSCKRLIECLKQSAAEITDLMV